MSIKPNTANLNSCRLIGSGDFESYWPGDACRYFILVPSTTNPLSARISGGSNSITSINAPILVGGRNNSFISTLTHFFASLGYGTPSRISGRGWDLGYSIGSTNPPNGVVFTQPSYIRVGNNNEVSGKLRLLHTCDQVRNVGDSYERFEGINYGNVPLM